MLGQQVLHAVDAETITHVELTVLGGSTHREEQEHGAPR
jgi:hypothetical protein